MFPDAQRRKSVVTRESPPVHEALDLGTLVEDSCAEISPLAEGKGQRLDRRIETGIEIEGDRRALARMAANLLCNAVKFTPAGGTIAVSLRREAGRALLTVADDGPGIPADLIPRIGERFFRVAEGRNDAEGAGLGLAIVKGIVRAHGGDLAVESPPGGGATFTVRLG